MDPMILDSLHLHLRRFSIQGYSERATVREIAEGAAVVLTGDKDGAKGRWRIEGGGDDCNG